MVTPSLSLPVPTPSNSTPDSAVAATASVAPDASQDSVDIPSFATRLDQARTQRSARNAPSTAADSKNAATVSEGTPQNESDETNSGGSDNAQMKPDGALWADGVHRTGPASPPLSRSGNKQQASDPTVNLSHAPGLQIGLPTVPILPMQAPAILQPVTPISPQSGMPNLVTLDSSVASAAQHLAQTTAADAAALPGAPAMSTSVISSGMASATASTTLPGTVALPMSGLVPPGNATLPAGLVVAKELSTGIPGVSPAVSANSATQTQPVAPGSNPPQKSVPPTPSATPMDSRVAPATASAPGIGSAKPSPVVNAPIGPISTPVANSSVPTASAASVPTQPSSVEQTTTDPVPGVTPQMPAAKEAGQASEPTTAASSPIPAAAVQITIQAQQHAPAVHAVVVVTTPHAPAGSATEGAHALDIDPSSAKIHTSGSTLNAGPAGLSEGKAANTGIHGTASVSAAQKLSGIERLFTLDGASARRVTPTEPQQSTQPAALPMATTRPASAQAADAPVTEPLASDGFQQVALSPSPLTAASATVAELATGTQQQQQAAPAHEVSSGANLVSGTTANGTMLTSAALAAVGSSSGSGAGDQSSHTTGQNSQTDPASGMSSVGQGRAEVASADSPKTFVSSLSQADTAAERARLVTQVTDHLETMRVVNGRGELTVHLQPESLGTVRVTITGDKDGLAARVMTESSQAQQAMEGGKDQLRAALEAKGLRVHTLEVSVGSGTSQNAGNPFAGPRDMPQNRAENGSYYRSGRAGHVEEASASSLPSIDTERRLGPVDPTSRLDYRA